MIRGTNSWKIGGITVPINTPRLLHEAVCRGSKTEPRYSVWERAYVHYLAAGYTVEDMEICFRYTRRENAKFTSAIQGFTITPFKVFDFEYRWFDSLLSQARASERNRRPAPTEKEKVLALRDPLRATEEADPRINGKGRHLSDVLKTIQNQ